ncbi:hypothetical protein GCM10023191_052890 [Actinoallomurus oryzae]|uniref:Uncharacterized protein n=1 Tax=Actinoallomurus oryzae TaxID=502180 RepID=A0ABP8QJ92_9ACTN
MDPARPLEVTGPLEVAGSRGGVPVPWNVRPPWGFHPTLIVQGQGPPGKAFRWLWMTRGAAYVVLRVRWEARGGDRPSDLGCIRVLDGESAEAGRFPPCEPGA